MVFTSMNFLLYFLPITLFMYFIVPKKFRKTRNLVLIVMSLFFYFVGEPRAIVWMLISIMLNYILGFIIGRSSDDKVKKISLLVAVLGNLSMLFYFKYMNFFMENIAGLIGGNYTLKNIIMPIGISFYTFQGMSYVIDVYRNPDYYQKNPLNVALYIALFPQLIAGPIVRYETIALQIEDRDENLDLIYYGIARFIIGFGKKMLLANKFGVMADEIFFMNEYTQMGVLISWFGGICYAFQIFFDFSGYSDMAIGLGKIFGFEFEENFNYPYISKSITEFWRRWHISLGTWFRDYVYIPLGGNRVGDLRHVLNIFTVWLLTGFWHGASWNYIIWGVYFAVLLLIEKYLLKGIKDRLPKFIQHLYALIFITIGWAIFRNEDLGLLIDYIKNMFGMYGLGSFKEIIYYVRQYYIEFIFGIVFSIPVLVDFERGKEGLISVVSYILIFLLSILSLLGTSFNPFIYFRF